MLIGGVETLPRAEAGVRAQQVDAAELVLGAGDHRLDLGPFGDVDPQREGAAGRGPSSSASVAAAGSSRSASTNAAAPSCANRRAMAAPIPLAAPVMTTTASCSCTLAPVGRPSSSVVGREA